MGKLPAVLLVLGLATGCGEAERLTGASPASCRNYPTALEENGDSFDCELEHGTEGLGLYCRSGTTLSRVTSYASLDDFIEEASVPNRWRRSHWRSRSGGPMLISSAETHLTYAYDDQGRLLRRSWSGQGEHVDFSEWDAQGRPTRGAITSGSRPAEAVTIAYDDAGRAARWSNGEEHVVDASGNPLRDMIMFGTFAMSRGYRIVSSGKVCR